MELVLNGLEKGYAVEYAITCKQKVNSAYHTDGFVYSFVKNAFMF